MWHTYRFLPALLLGAAPPLLLAFWPAAPVPVHQHQVSHGEHAPAPVGSPIVTPIPAGAGASAWDRRLPEWPAGGQVLEVGEGRAYTTLAGALAVARAGDHLILHGGEHPGPVKLDRPVWIEGRHAVIDGGGQGTVITVASPGARVSGLTLRGSGHSLDNQDVGVAVTDAPGAVVAGCNLAEVQSGIVVKNSPGALIAGNTIEGRGGKLSLVGAGIRVWYSEGARLIANTVRHTREVMVEATANVEVTANAVVGGRLGLHLMRSPGAVATRNFLGGNSTGIYVMYGANTRLVGNYALRNRGPSGYGIAVKEADNTRLEENWVTGNRVGIYLDMSPLDGDRPNSISGNLISFNDIGMSLTPATRGNRVWGNDVLENYQQVGGHGGGSLGLNLWTVQGKGNYWSDYAGYDADADGTGDQIHGPVRVFEGWMDRQPSLRWFWFTPAAAAVDLAARAFPLAAPSPLITDERPAMSPADRRDSPWSTYRQ